MSDLTIGYLADHPEALPALAEAFRAESPGYFGTEPMEAIVARLLAPTMQRAALPLALVAHRGGALVGTVALRPDSISTRPDLGPWVAALQVLPPFRGQGAGTRLLRAAESAARRLDLTTLYAGTGRAATLFMRCGWRVLETIPYHGQPLTLLCRELAEVEPDVPAIQDVARR